ncbi:DUF4345 domain-containing protein [Dyadobacter sp. CY345]|uniref:DUF4345 domain-containing protein n=1 Tax=Dyadobacter sp. CY345 TaxID=2909335 RepID=UPI001F2BD3C3|nr:DUF4345 domain-containing protein [Dyadobacter sp. CY345]MCF2446699.1 DUF4345 domain-containing protein [Dyadobacter sp. CY345]
MNGISSKKLLQVMMCLLALAPLLTGILGLSGIYNPIYPGLSYSENVLLDSNLRFLNGVSIALGISVFAVIPNIEKKTFSYRLIWGMIFLGGLSRLLSVWSLGLPPFPMPIFMAIEILVPIPFLYWQNQIALKDRDK